MSDLNQYIALVKFHWNTKTIGRQMTSTATNKHNKPLF